MKYLWLQWLQIQALDHMFERICVVFEEIFSNNKIHINNWF